jgi:ATP-dependent DNA ligase
MTCACRASVTDDPAAARFMAQTIARGHEGLVVKALDSPYARAARRSRLTGSRQTKI